jgi:uncharacterized protein YggT (Ycf19 family)
MGGLWQYWYFHIPNFVLAAVMYTLLGRLVLGFFVPADWDNYIWRAFRTITDPAVRIVRIITPQAIGDTVVLIFGALWMMLLRLAYLVILANLGLAPVASQGTG